MGHGVARWLGRLTFNRVYWPLFILAFVFIAGVVVVLSRHLESGASRVNMAGRQRMYIEKMAKEALILSHAAPRPNGGTGSVAAVRRHARRNLEKALDRFAVMHRRLLKGGEDIRRVTDTEARRRLRRVDALWRPYRDTLRSVTDGPVAWSQVRDITRRSNELMAAMDRVVARLETVADARAARRRWLAFLMLGGVGVLLVLGIVLGLAHRRSAVARDRLYHVIQEIPDLVFYKDANFTYLGCNRAFANFVGKSQSFIQGATDYDLFDRETADFFRTMDRRMLETGTSRRNEEWVHYPDGTWAYLDMLKAPLGVDATPFGVVGLGRDITAREEARAARDRLLAILEATPDFVGISDPEGNALYLNPGARHLLGLDETGGSMAVVAEGHPEWALRRLTEEAFPQARRHGFWQGETAFRDVHGTEIPASQIVLAHYDEGGQVTHLSTIARDIRDQKQAEAALREAAAQAESVANSLINTLPGVFFLCDADGTLRRWNQALETVTGHDSAAMRDLDAWTLFTPDHRERVGHAFEAVRAQGSGTVEADLAPVAGAPVRHFFSARALDLHGTPCITVVGMDISAIRHLEAERERLAAIIEATPDFVGIATPDGQVVYRNPGARTLVGDAGHADGLLGGSGRSQPEWAARRMRQEGIPAALRDGLWAGETAFIDQDGEEIPVSQIILAHHDDQGRLTHLSTIARDIRDQKRAEAAVRRSNEELESFAYAVSHDLQEPLRMVVSYVELMHTRYSHVLDERGRALLGHALDSARRMRTMIRDLLEYSRVQTQGSAPAPLDAGEAVREALDNLEERRRETDAELVVDETLPTVLADHGQLVRVFQNLVGNALKHHAPDTAPRVRITAEPAGEAGWCFTVADNGPGIPDEERERIFEVFHRGDNHGQGTGIGLSLVRRIVERHGGRIRVETAPEGGSAFRFTLPAA